MNEENFISGIYNHCDRWCERCIFNDKCRLYFNEKKQFNALEDKEDFLKIVSQNFEKTLNMLKEIADEKGIDLDNLEDDGSFEIEEQKSEAARKHPLSKKAYDYSDKVMKWFKSNSHLNVFKNKYLKNIDLGIELDESDKAIRMIDEASNIIQWYQFQIHVKLASAINSYPHDPEFENEMENMHHSSAKIALIGVENSIKAWHSMMQYTENEEDFIIDTVLMLQNIKAQIHKKFPLLQKYKRPFFND